MLNSLDFERKKKNKIKIEGQEFEMIIINFIKVKR